MNQRSNVLLWMGNNNVHFFAIKNVHILAISDVRFLANKNVHSAWKRRIFALSFIGSPFFHLDKIICSWQHGVNNVVLSQLGIFCTWVNHIYDNSKQEDPAMRKKNAVIWIILWTSWRPKSFAEANGTWRKEPKLPSCRLIMIWPSMTTLSPVVSVNSKWTS